MAVSKEINELVNAYCRLRDRQHAVYTPAFAGLRQGRQAMPRLRRHIAAHRPLLQGFGFLPALPEIMGKEDEISISDKAPFRIG